MILLIQIVESEIRSRNLKTSFELSLLLTQFSCEELTKLMEEEIVENLNHSDVQELRKSLVTIGGHFFRRAEFEFCKIFEIEIFR